MAWIHPEWVEYQRKRFMRPDAYRWLPFDQVLTDDRAPLHLRKYRADPPREAEQRDAAAGSAVMFEAELAEYRLALARLRLDVELFKFALRGWKAGFNPSQPRVPAGNPDGGQWTSEGEADRSSDRETGRSSNHTDFSAVRRDRAKGHHYVPRQLFENLDLMDETREVFENAKTGRLYDIRNNKNDREHRIYNKAVSELFDKFTRALDITPQAMTPDQARQFVREVQDSKDPRIRNFNMRIQLREIMHRVQTRTRGNE